MYRKSLKTRKQEAKRHTGKLIVQKGIAGLGNRLQVLGRVVDMAHETGRSWFADWRDSSWEDGFDPYFEQLPGLVGAEGCSVWPNPWTPETLWTRGPKALWGDRGRTSYRARDTAEN